MNCNLSATVPNEYSAPQRPKTGDIVQCSDNDIGVVIATRLDCSPDVREQRLMVEIEWVGAGRCTDVWASKDFSTLNPLFRVVSRA